MSKTNSDKEVFDFHVSFLITQRPFCQTKFPLYWGKEPFYKNIFIEFFHFKYFLNFSLFFFWNVITYFIRLFYNTRGIMAFMLKIWTLIVDNRLNRYAHHPLRKYFLWNTWLWIKTFYFSRLLWIILARFSKKTYLC